MAKENKDTLQSKAVLTLLDLLGEGEIGGLTDGLQSVFLNETPVLNPDGSSNFQGVTAQWTNGTSTQAPLGYYGNFSESPFNAGVRVKKDLPYTFTISSPVADAVRVTVSLPGLSKTNPDNGDISRTSVSYSFSRSVDNGPFVDLSAGELWFSGGTITTVAGNLTFDAAGGSTGVRATVKLAYDNTTGSADPSETGSITAQAQGWTGAAWVDIGAPKVLSLQWVFQSYMEIGEFTQATPVYALATDPYVVESTYSRVRFVTSNLTSAKVSLEAVGVESRSSSSIVVIDGKSRSRYQKSHILAIPRPAQSVRFRVTRLTDDSNSIYLANETYMDSWSEITTLNMSYPNSALFGMRIDSEQFNQIPSRAFLVDGLKIQVPTNYNVTARTYTGVWDGTFKREVSNNPAWVLYDLLTNTRYGLGDFIAPTQVDKATLYTIGRYCDELVSDGAGVTEPRFTLNTVIASQTEAYKVISDITSVFRGMGFWDGGMVKFTQDSPADPMMLFTSANVIEGMFNYTGSARKDRHSVVHVTWNDPDDLYRKRVEYVEDAELISKYGIKKLDTLAFGCTSRGQAARVGRWVLYTERYESDFITFKVGLDAALVSPGDIVKIHDSSRAGNRQGGRLVACTISEATLDAPVDVISTPASLSLMMPDGSYIEREITNGLGTHTVVDFSGTLTTLPPDNAVWIMSQPNLEPVFARVVSVTQGDTETQFEITAVENNSSKYDLIENGYTLEKRKTSILDPNFIEAPRNLTVVETTYQPSPSVLASKLILSWFGNSTSYDVSWRGTSPTNASNWTTSRIADSSLSFEVFNVVPGGYEFSIIGINPLGTRSTAVSASYEVQGKTSPPANVTGFSAQNVNDSVLLTWVGVSDVDLKAYEVRKSPAIGDAWDLGIFVGTVSAVTNQLNVGPVVAGTSHEWQIRAIDDSDNYSVAAARAAFTKPAITGVTISFEYIQATLKLSWTSAAEPAYWRIRRGSTYASSTVVATQVYDKTVNIPVNWNSGQVFWVTPVDSTGAEGSFTSVSVPFSFPAAPVVDGARQGASLQLSWTTPVSTLPIDQYEIRYGALYASSSLLGYSVGNQTVFQIQWAGDTTIWVSAIDSGGNKGTPGGAQYVSSAPPAPVNFTAQAGLGTITLKWDEAVYPAHDYAELFRSDTNNFSLATPLARSTVSTYADAIGTTGATKYYWIRFVDKLEVGGDFSSVVSATTGLVGGVDMSDLTITAAKLADDAVENGKIKDAAITTTKIANLAVGSAAIKNLAVTNAKIANLAVDNAKIANLDAVKITTGLLVAERIDSRGLSIKDISGNVILAAGSPLDYANVGGSTKPQDGATRNVFRGNWALSGVYAVGDIVIDNDNGWSCTVAHTSTSVNRPPALSTGTSTFWSLYAAKGADGAAGEDGVAALTLVLSNEAHTLPANSSGVVSSYTGSGTTITVYEGVTALAASATATTSAFRVGAIAQTPASTLTTGATTYSGTVATIAAHSAMLASTDVVTLTIPITIYRADGTSVTVSKIQTITKSKAGVQGINGTSGTNGADAVVGYLTNEAMTVAADSAGSVSSFSSAGGSFKVYNGTTDVTASSTFSVATSTGVVIAINATTGVYTVSSLSADTGSATLRAVYSGVTIDKTYSISKSKAGASGTNGAAAQLVALSSTAQSFKFDATGAASPSTQTITFTAALQNITGTATFAATSYTSAGAIIGSITLGGTGNTRTLTNAQFASAAYVVVTATLSGLTDTITVARLQDGATGSTGAAGATGPQGPAVVIASSRATVFTATDGTLDAAQSNITFTANVSGVTSPTYVWTLSGFQTAPTASTTSTQTITAAQFGTSKSATVTCLVSGAYSDTVTIVRLERSSAAAGATKNVIYRQATAPTAGVVNGDIWVDTSVTPNAQYVRAAGAWELAATVGASFDTTNAGAISGQITSGNVSTYIADAAITNAKIGNVIQSSSYVANTAGWKIDKAGTMEMNDAVFRGTLNVKSAASGARLEITGDVIKVYDAAGVLRVRLGNLSA